MSDPRPTERTIFLSAIERRSATERAAYLDAACAGDDRLRAAVEELLAAHDRLGTVDSPASAADPWATSDVPAAGDGPGAVIGPYKLLEPIGEGGFGTVYLAEQVAPVRRKVALKVLKPGMDSRQVVARFEAERQALAIMDHPHIAKVFDGGTTPAGHPFFVMELVRGAPITDFCDRNHLPPRERLGLFVQVCQAVQHAHQKGVIHRDLKPSNVLVSRHDSTPVVKVIDFGVAKALGGGLTDKTLVTGLAQMVGTPLYMSPEQAGMSDLDVDTRSDIYSLGVLLYELLTGTTPFIRERFKKAAYDEIRRIIREEEPPKPSTRLSESGDVLPSVAAQRHTEPAKLTRLVRGELDWIVMKALEKDRNRRYETATGFALDVQRYLAGEPVQAVPPSAAYRLRKFARKNRGAVTATALVLLSVVGGAIGAVYGVVQSGKERTAALQRQLEDERRETEAAADRAARRSRTAASVATALEDARARTGEAWALADDPSKMRTATDLALAAVRRAEGFADAGEAPEETLAELAAGRAAAADLDRHTRLFVAADQAVQDRDVMREAEPGRKKTAARLEVAFRAFGWDPLRGPPDAIAAEAVTSRVRDKVLGFLCDWENTEYRDRAAQEQLQKVIRAARLRAGGHLADWQRLKDASDLIGLTALAARPEVLALGPELLCALGRDLRYWGHNEEGELALLRRAAARYPGHVWVNDELCLACINASPPRRSEALRAAAAAAAIRPDNVLLQNRVGQMYENLGENDLAAAQYRKAIALAPTYTFSYQALARVLTQAGDPGGAAAVYREYVGRVPDPAASHFWLGKALLEAKDMAGAAAAFREAIRREPDYAAAHDYLGECLRALGDLDGAIAEFKEALRHTLHHPPDRMPITNAHENLWAALVEKNARTGAAGDALDLAAFAEMTRAHPKDPWPHVKLGTLRWDRGDTKGALARYRDAVRADPEDYLAVSSLGGALLAARDYAEVPAAYRPLVRRWSRDPNVRSEFASVLAHAGDLAGAIAEFKEVIRLNPNAAEAHVTLAKMLAAGPDGVRDGKAAVEIATRACELSRWKEPRYIGLLAAAYAESGDFGKAVEYQKKALAFPEYGKEHGDRMRQRLDLYAHQKPYRETDWGLRLVAPPGAAVWRHWHAVSRDPKNAARHYYDAGNALRAAGQLGQAEAAYRAAAAAQERKNPADAGSLYDAARFRALAAAAQARAGGPDAGRLAKEEADRAAALLAKAVAAGYADIIHLGRDDDLDCLRGREDFRKLLAEAVAKAPPADRARYHILLGEWDKAAAVYDRNATTLADYDFFLLGSLSLIRGDDQAYAAVCQAMTRRENRTPHSFDLARACAIGRKCPVDPAQTLLWAKRVVADDPTPWGFHVLGLAQCRAGRFDEALESFTKSNAGEWVHRDLNQFGLALVHLTRGQPDEAQRCLNKGVQWLEREGPSGPGRPAKLLPQDWLAGQVLRREAQDLLKVKRSP